MKKPPTEFNLEDACWDGYEAVNTKKKDGRTVPNCVPKAKSARPGPRRATSEAARSIAADLDATYGIQAWVEDAIVFVDAKNFERAKQARAEQNKKHYNPRIALRAVTSSRPGNAVKFATPEQIKEEYRQLKQVPKQRLFDMWARETLGRVHNANIQDQDKSNMAVDLIRSRFPRKDYEAAGFKVESSRPGAKVKMAEPLPTRPIGSGQNRHLVYHQAVAEEIKQIKDVRDSLSYLREQLVNAKSDMNGAIASFMKVKEFEDEAKAKAQFQLAENQFKTAKDMARAYLKQLRFARPGAKAKFEATGSKKYFLGELDTIIAGISEMNRLLEKQAKGNPKIKEVLTALAKAESLMVTAESKLMQIDFARPGAKVK